MFFFHLGFQQDLCYSLSLNYMVKVFYSSKIQNLIAVVHSLNNVNAIVF